MTASNMSSATAPWPTSTDSAAELGLSPTSPMRAVFEAASDMMVWVRVEPGPTFRVVAANPACLRLARAMGFAITAADLVGHSLVELAKRFVADPDEAGRWLRRYETVLEGRAALDDEVVLATPSGDHRIRLRLTPILDAEGRCHSILHSSHDATDLTRALAMLGASEEKFARAFQSTPAAMAISRLNDGTFLDVNAATCKLWGYAREEFIGRKASELRLWFRPADREEFFKTFSATGSVRDFEITIRTKREELLTVLFSAERIEVGGEQCMVASVHDVSAAREAERIRRQVEEQLRQSQKLEALGTLAGGVAHDFNNILTAVVGVTDLVELDIGSPDSIREHVNELRAAGKRAQSLVRQILTFSRRHEQERRAFDLRDVVKDALGMLRVGLPASLEIESRIDEAPVLVFADPNQIHQVLMNLGTNAAYAMRSMPGTMTVTVDRVTTRVAKIMTVSQIEPGAHARIVVEDRGEGIDEGIFARLFEPFFTTKKTGEGSGLGLAVVHGIVRDHHGALDVASRRGEGTRVSVYLPLHEGSAMEAVEPPVATAAMGRGERVLLVDDEDAIGKVCGSLLTRGGYQVEVFKSPEEALARFSNVPDEFDLVITDLAMPRMNGDQLARTVLALRPNIPVLMITGNSAGLTRQRLRDLGVFALLQKPITRQALTTAVRRALDGLA